MSVDTRLETTAAKTTNDFWSQTLAARSGDGESLAEFGLSSDGIIEAYGSNSSTGDLPDYTQPANLNQRYHLTMRLNFGLHTASYYVDNTLIGTILDASTSDQLLRGALVTYA